MSIAVLEPQYSQVRRDDLQQRHNFKISLGFEQYRKGGHSVRDVYFICIEIGCVGEILVLEYSF